MTQFSERVSSLEPEGAYHMLARAKELESSGRSIIHLEIGQPDVPTYENISQAGIKAIKEGHTGYTPSAGLPVLRQVIAEDAGLRREIQVKPNHVVIGPGAKPALFFPTLALLRPDDEVIYPDPGFPTYKAMIEVAGGNPVPVPLREEDDFSFDLEVFDRLISPHTRMVVINSPSNPTGGVLSHLTLEHIAKTAILHNLWVLSDEIYSRLVYDQPALSIAALPGMMERTVICDGFSKTYSMTGWRLGYGIMPEPLAERVDLLLNHSVGCTANFTQVAGIEGLLGPQTQIESVLAEYRSRRDVLVSGLNGIPGINCRTPQGAFYVFPNIKAYGKKSEWLANYLLEEFGVAVLSGTAFGKYGEGYLRLCFANSMEKLNTALGLLTEAFKKLQY